MGEPGVELSERGRGELVTGEAAFSVLVCLGGGAGAGGCDYISGIQQCRRIKEDWGSSHK